MFSIVLLYIYFEFDIGMHSTQKLLRSADWCERHLIMSFERITHNVSWIYSPRNLVQHHSNSFIGVEKVLIERQVG